MKSLLVVDSVLIKVVMGCSETEKESNESQDLKQLGFFFSDLVWPLHNKIFFPLERTAQRISIRVSYIQSGLILYNYSLLYCTLLSSAHTHLGQY